MSDKLIDLSNVATRNILKSAGINFGNFDTTTVDVDVLEQFAEYMVHATLLVIDMDVGALSAEEHAAVLLGVQQRFGKVD